MSEPKDSLKEAKQNGAKQEAGKNFRRLLWFIVFAAVVYLVFRNISVFGNVLLVVLGFGAVVLIHEFGHFIVAKLSGIKVEVFSIGFPPTLAGVRRVERGWRVRILPKFFPKENDESGDGRLSFTIGRRAKAGETEYRIGLVPFGGFNKMLGQEDTGPAKASDDPRSYANKPVGVRMAVISAGVFFNVISAIVIFMIVFLIGIRLMPPVVGGVIPNSPAARAGLRAGDEIIEIAGKSDGLDFSDVLMGAALSGKDEEVALKVKHEDGSIENFTLVAEQIQTRRGPMRGFGIWPPQSLTISKVSDSDELLARTGLLAGDHIKSVNGKDVHTHWEFEEMVAASLVPTVTLSAERIAPVSKKSEVVESQVRLSLGPAEGQVKSESDLSHIYSMVPRLRIEVVDTESSLQEGDIILAIGDVSNPTYKEMREVTEEYEGKKLSIKVLRVDAKGVEEELTVTVVPKCPRGGDRVLIGIIPVLDAEHSVVAKTIAAEGGPARLEIPRGAVITAVGGVGVSNFYDIIREIGRYPGERITVDWRIDDETAGSVALDVGTAGEFITVKSTFAEIVPVEDLKRLYQASGPVDAIVTGYRKTIMFIAQTYVSIRRLISGLVSRKQLSGPVGIIAMTYRIVSEQPLIYYVYVLGIISVLLAVFNFLPLPPFDGGHIVLLSIEKIKGSALSERAQGVIAYGGVVFIIALFLYLTFNDIVNIFFG